MSEMPGTRRSEAARMLALVALCLFLYFFHLGARPLWDVDEGWHAGISVEMVETGDWVRPSFNGEAFFDKPAFFNWLVAISFSVLGVSEFAARLPAAVLAVLIVLATYRLGRRMAGPNAGFLAGIVMATAVEHVALAKTIVHDSALALAVTVALLAFFEAYEDESRRKRWMLLFWVACGIGFLAKGPIGIMLPGMVIFLFLLVERRLGFMWKMSLGWGIPLFLLVAAPWFIALSLREPEYFEHFFWRQNLGRFFASAHEGHHHEQPFYYYFGILLAGLLPWSFLVPVAIWRGIVSRTGPEGRGVRFSLIWFGSILLFFSAASGKLATYVYPLFPAVAILTGMMLRDLLESPPPWLLRSVQIAYVVFAVVLVAGIALYPLLSPENQERTTGIRTADIVLIGVTASAIVLLGVWRILRRDARGFVAANVGFAAAGVLGFSLLLVPAMSPFRSTRNLALRLDAVLPPGQDLHFFWRWQDTAIFYARRNATTLRRRKDLAALLASDERFYCIIERRHLPKIVQLSDSFHVVAVHGDRYVISNRDSPLEP